MGLHSFKDVFGGAAKKGGEVAIEDLDFQEKFPVLAMVLTRTVADDGKPRQVCTMTVVCEDGLVKAGLRERDHNLSLWTSSQSLGGVFAALEEALTAKPPMWRKVDDKWKKR